MDDLIAFVTARLDDDEAVAKAAVDSSGNLEWFDSLVRASGDHTVRTRPGNRPVARIRLDDSKAVDGRTLDPDACAAHIARHDPARALRDVEAGRRLLANYEEIALLNPDGTPQERALRMATAEVVRMLILDRAAVWSDHPDYRPEWAAADR